MVYGRISPSRRSASRTSPESRAQTRHHVIAAITLIPLLLDLLLARHINVFRWWRPFAHPLIGFLRLAVAGQRFQPVDVVAIHDPWLVVEMRRDSRGNGGLGSGDLLDG